MSSRREFTLGVAAGAFFTGTGSINAPAAGTPTQAAPIIDAMGEIRDLYTDQLCRGTIDPGTNSVTVTRCYARSFEKQARAWAMHGVRGHDRFIKKAAEFRLMATALAAIDIAHQEGKIALFHLLQDSTPFRRNLDNVDVFYGPRVHPSQIACNYQNRAGTGCNELNGPELTAPGPLGCRRRGSGD